MPREGAELHFPTVETSEALGRVFDELDYGALAEIYCHEGGDSFWAQRRQPTLDLGLLWAKALAPRLAGGGRGGASLYVGAGVAELPAVLMEALDLERRLTVTNLDPRECEVLNQALGRCGLGGRLSFLVGDALQHLGEGPFDHLSLVSVLDDPETYPLVSAVTYGRIPPVLLDVDAFLEERRKVQGLVAGLLDAMQLPFTVTTTFEEVPWLMQEGESRGLEFEADEETVETAMVGDPIGFLRIRAGE